MKNSHPLIGVFIAFVIIAVGISLGIYYSKKGATTTTTGQVAGGTGGTTTTTTTTLPPTTSTTTTTTLPPTTTTTLPPTTSTTTTTLPPTTTTTSPPVTTTEPPTTTSPPVTTTEPPTGVKDETFPVTTDFMVRRQGWLASSQPPINDQVMWFLRDKNAFNKLSSVMTASQAVYLDNPIMWRPYYWVKLTDLKNAMYSDIEGKVFGKAFSANIADYLMGVDGRVLIPPEIFNGCIQNQLIDSKTYFSGMTQWQTENVVLIRDQSVGPAAKLPPSSKYITITNGQVSLNGVTGGAANFVSSNFRKFVDILTTSSSRELMGRNQLYYAYRWVPVEWLAQARKNDTNSTIVPRYDFGITNIISQNGKVLIPLDVADRITSSGLLPAIISSDDRSLVLRRANLSSTWGTVTGTQEVVSNCDLTVCHGEGYPLVNADAPSVYICPDNYGKLGWSQRRCNLVFMKSQDFPGYWEIQTSGGQTITTYQNQYNTFSTDQGPDHTIARFLVGQGRNTGEFVLIAKDTGLYLSLTKDMYPSLQGVNPTTQDTRVFWKLIK